MLRRELGKDLRRALSRLRPVGPRRLSTGVKAGDDWRRDFVHFGPLADLPASDRDRIIGKVARDARKRFDRSAAKIAAIFAAGDPSGILAGLALQCLSVRGDEANRHLEIHHLELAQAMALRAPATRRRKRPLEPAVSALGPLLRENAAAFQERMLDRSQPLAGAQLAITQYQMRRTTQTVRGDVLPEQTKRYLRALLGRIDDPFRAAYGVSGVDAVEVLWSLLARVELGINAWARNPARGDLEVVWRFDASDVRAVLPDGADEGAVLALLRRWSLAYGDLADLSVDLIHLANPVWTKPFIRIEEGVFQWPNPGMTMAFALRMFETLSRPPKPRRPRTDLWVRILSDLAEHRPGGWLDHSHRLLGVDHETQANLQGQLLRMLVQVRLSERPDDAQWALIHDPDNAQGGFVAVIVHAASSPPVRDDMIARARARLFEETGAPDGLVVAIDARRWPEVGADIRLVAAS